MPVFMDPTFDSIFKHLFASNDRKNLSMSLINALCNLEGDDRVTTIKFLNQETVPGSHLIQGGKTLVDIYCETDNKNKFIVELQRKPEKEMLERIMLYFAQMFIGQYDYKIGPKSLYPVIVLSINNSIPALEHKKAYKSIHKLMDIETHENDMKHIGFVLIELDNFTKNEAELETDEEKWLFFLKTIANALEVPKALQTGEFKQACELLNLMTKSTQERMEYDNMRYAERSMQSTYEAERTEADAKAEAKGIAEGERKAKIELAKKMLLKKKPLEEIAEITGLSVEELAKL